MGVCYLVLLFLFILFPLLWNISNSFRYYAKFTLYTLWIMTTASIFIPVYIFRPNHVQNLWIAGQWLRNTLWFLGLKFEVRNRSSMQYDKPCIIVCNHQSIIDVAGMMEIFPPRTTVLAKKELMFAGPFGIASWLAGMIFVDRLNRERARETVEKTVSIMLQRNANVWIFPEGTRNSGEKLLPFKKGAFHLAVQAQVPIFPVVFSSYRNFLSHGNKKAFNSGKVIISCLPRVETTGLGLDDVNKLADQVHDSMESAFVAATAEFAVSNGNGGLNPSQTAHPDHLLTQSNAFRGTTPSHSSG